jgi:hypothetical protein
MQYIRDLIHDIRMALAVFLLAPNCDLSRRAASEKDKT